MSPPSPIPEHEFERFLREFGLEGKRKGKEFAAYRKFDGKLVAGYAVRHGDGKREVLVVYRRKILAALELLRQEEEMVQFEGQRLENNSDAWKDAQWCKKQLNMEEEISSIQQMSENQDDQ